MDAENFLISAAGVRMPRIIYGTAWKKQQTAALVEQALNLGFRGIDTACQPKHYHEAGVGAGLAAALHDDISRAAVYLQTKFTPVNGQDPLQIPYDSQAELGEQVLQSCQVSLQNLQTTYLDCLLLHSPLANQQQLIQVWRAMEQLVDSGKVRQLGISNCYDQQQFEYLYQQARIKPAVLQNRFYADSGYDCGLRQFCRQQHIVYQSFWTLTANPQLLGHETVQQLAKQYQCTTAQLFFRYLTQTDILPLTGTSSAQHMREDLAIFKLTLTPADCAALTKLISP